MNRDVWPTSDFLERTAPRRGCTVLFVAVLACLAAAPPTAAQDAPTRAPTAEGERQPRFFQGAVRFITLAEGVADLRLFDADAAARALPPIDASAGNTAEGAIEAARRVFDGRSFDAVEKLAKAGKIDAQTSTIVAEGRRRMIAEALKRVTAEYDAGGTKLIIGVLDSGNKGSGIASDIDQTIFAMTPDGRPSGVNPADIIGKFDAAFRAMYGFDPGHFGIESMNGADFYPDWRAQHHSLEGFGVEARRVVLEKRLNPEAYRSEGELKIQAEGRGYEALREYFEQLKTLDDQLARRRAASTHANPDADPAVQRLRAQIQEVQRLAPWSQFEMRIDEAGNREAAEVRDSDPRNQVMQNEPELVRRFAFDGSYDNWLMWQAHPGNRPKYLLRSVADGIGLLTQLRFDGEGAGRYDLDRPWVAKPVEYEKVYADASLQGEEMRRQFLRDVYGDLAGRETGLTLDRVEKALGVAARARLRHKGTGGFATMTELQIYREYLPQGERFADWTDEQRLSWAKRAWEVDAREVMLENLLRTVRSPGDITQGWGDPDEWRAIRERFPAAERAHLTPTRLKGAAWLQLYHGFLDLMTNEHARQILEGLEQGRRPLSGITGEPEGRPRDMVDRLVLELSRVSGPEAAEARTELEKVLIDAAVTRQKLDPDLGQPRLGTAVHEVVRQELRQRILATRTSIAEMRQQYETVRQKLLAGEYTKEVVADRVLEGTANRLAQATASVLQTLGFRGEVQVRRTINHLADIEQRGVPEIEIRLADQAWSARQALTDFASSGNVDSFAQIILAYQEGGAAEAAKATVRELAMNVPGVSQSTAVWDGVITGNWQGAWMAGTGMMLPVAGQGYVLVSIATTSVRIVGNAVLEPLANDTRDMAYQGFLGAENDFLEDRRGQRFNVLYTVPITVIPYDVEAPDGTKVTQYSLGEYPLEEAIRVLVEQSGDPDSGVDLEGIPLDTVYAFGQREGLWGGGREWDGLSARAADWLSNPRLNFEAKRASLWHHYKDEVDAWLASRGLEDTDVLLATEMRSDATETLSHFFIQKVGDWAFGRGAFEGVVGGENELLLPVVAEERTRFFQRIALRMAGDYIRSYRIIHLQPVRTEAGPLADASLEAGLARGVSRALQARLQEEVTTLAVAVDEARRSGDVPPALAEAVHRMRLERNQPKDARPRVHVRPRVLGSGQSDAGVDDSAPAATDSTGSDRIDFYVSVVANPERFAPPYRHETEWILEETQDSARMALAAVVRVYDRTGKQVGDSVFVELGTLRGEAELVALEPIVEVRVGPADSPPSPDPASPGAPSADAGGDAALADYLIYDDLTVYFQPARDTANTVWRWRFIRVAADGDTAGASSGLYHPGESTFNTTRRAAPGAPAPFQAGLGAIWNEGAAGPGTYVLQTCLPSEMTILGQTVDWSGCLSPHVDDVTGEAEPLRPWQDEGRFEVGAATLVLKDFIAEQGAIAWDPERGPWLSLENARSGSASGADVVYTWDECVSADQPAQTRAPPCDRHGAGWYARRHTERTRLAVALPQELDLQAPIMGELSARLAPAGALSVRPTARIGPLVPATDASRDLARIALYGATAGVHPPEADDRASTFTPPAAPADGQDHPYHVHNGYRRDPGAPERPMGVWIRDDDAYWFVPISIEVSGHAMHAFAVYGTRPGPYTGAVPRAPDAIGTLASEPGGGVQPGGTPGDSTESGVGPGRPGGPVDPGALDPNSPDASGLIREWISAARPPAAVEPDNHYTYDEWGRVTGSGADGIITATAPPDGRGAMSPVEYVWTLRDDLDSVDHCTLGEYVTRSLEGNVGAILECRGRYRPMARADDYRGRPVGAVRGELESAGHAVEVSVADWPSSADQAYTVLRQTPTPGARLPRGSMVRLGIYGPYETRERAGRTVASVYGLTFEDAKAILADSGFVVGVPGGGDPAPTQDLAFRVSAQSVAGGESRAEGTQIRLILYGPYGGRRGDPTPPPPAEARGPSCNELVRGANGAQGRGDLNAAYELYRAALQNGCTNPGLRDAMNSVYQSPTCTRLIRGARSAYDRQDFQSAIQTLRSAEREGCDMSGLGPLVQGTLTALETGVAEAMGRSCTGVAEQIAAARSRGDEGTAQALATTALLQGCSGEEISTAVTTPLPRSDPDERRDAGRVEGVTPAPVDVEHAETVDFVGAFNLRDPARTTEAYRGNVVFRGDRTFTADEWVDGRHITGQGRWSWDPQRQVFVIDWEPGGRFEGGVAGNTNDFVIAGLWSNGTAGRLHIVR